MKKRKNAVQLADDELFTAENLPFQRESVADFYPVIKQIDFTSKYASSKIQEGKICTNDGKLD